MQIDIRTAKQRKREAIQRKVVASWLELKEANPEAKPFRLVSVIAERVGLTAMGVRGILIRKALYPQTTNN